ncbi:MAG: PDZ domain-containing protein [Labilithrix sp.]|nr:PDZ domain-containing protein [Labilithrix sp.]
MAPGIRVPLAATLVLLAAACGESTPTPKSASAAAAPSAEPARPPPAPVTELKRAAIKDTIAQGLGVFLQNVTVEDWPVMHDGKFHGFKIRSINADWGVDLQPGDVVTRINGIVPEHPEEADAALRALEKASALKVDFERDGKAKTLELPIVD